MDLRGCSPFFEFHLEDTFHPYRYSITFEQEGNQQYGAGCASEHDC